MTARRLVYYAGIAMICAWILVPIWLIAVGAIGGRQGVFLWPKSLWPREFSFAAVELFLRIEGVGKALWNSVLAAALTMVLSVALGAPAGYALARFAFRGQNAYRLLILLTRAFPIAILALPLTVSFIRWGLYDTVFGVALVHTALALPFAALVSSSLFAGIPRELEEAAWVFGCTRLQAFAKIVLPLALPGIAATARFTSSNAWTAPKLLRIPSMTMPAMIPQRLAMPHIANR
ncbi:MAG: carbohydrate ABC transporter permease [Tagaea sp.]